MDAFPCSRCEGRGRISHHANVLGGVCFKCGGSGTQKSKPRVSKSFSWNVYADERVSGARVHVFRVAAATGEAALQKARSQLARGTGYLPESAHVERVRLPP